MIPLVTVVIPCYNQGKFVVEAIQSVITQTHTKVELIVVDDGSTDESRQEIKRSISGVSEARLISQSNKGVSVARNIGVKASSPESNYLLFLDADDFLHPEMISHLVNYLENNESAGAAFCRYQKIRDDGSKIGAPCDYFAPVAHPTAFGVKRLNKNINIISFFTAFTDTVNLPSNTLIRHNVFNRVGGWDEDLPQLVEDKDLFMRLALWSELHFSGQGLIFRRYHSNQATQNLDRIELANKKLFSYWKRKINSLESEDRKVVEKAFCLWTGRVVAGKRLLGSLHHFRNGRPMISFRDLLSAFKLYMLSFIGIYSL